MAKLQTLLLAFFTLVCLSARGQTFTNPVRVATPVDPDAVLSGDLNGDGRVDLIWLGVTATDTVGHIELAQANGGYLPGRTFTIPGTPTGVPMCVAADVTGDRKLDIICATLYRETQTTTLFVFPGNGNGTLAAPISTPFSNQSEDIQGILLASVGDLNADGVPDFVLEDDDYTPAFVLLSDGKGGFLPPKTVAASYNYSVPIAADVNGDGIPDILWPQGATVALGKGDGSFSGLTPTPFSALDGPVDCAFHDMDGDGKLDAVCGYFLTSGNGTALDILHGNGDGTFNPSPIFHTTFGSPSISQSGSGDFLMPEAVSDVNGDGVPDILAYSGDGLAVLLGQPGLTFAAPAEYALAYSGYASPTRADAQRKYADLNGDGLLDVLTAGPNGMYLILGHPDGTFGSALATKVSEVSGHIAVADFNGDGKPDLVSTGAPGTSLSFGNGDGTFAGPSSVQDAPFAAGANIYVADFNGDGKADLLSSDASMAPYIMLGKGDGTFSPAIATNGLPTLFPLASTTTDYTVRYNLIADLNSDGKTDVFLIDTDSSSPTYSLVSALSAGDGSFRTVRTTYPAPVYMTGTYYYTPVAPVLGDFAHRGQLDAAYYLAESIYIVRGHGDGSFEATPTVLSIPTVAGVKADQFQALQVGDFDGDGKLDLAFLSWFQLGNFFYQGGPSCVFIYFGNGDGTFQSATQAGCFTHAYTDFRVADVNGDGRPDLVMQTTSTFNTYVVGVAESLGSRTFGPEINYTAGSLSGDLFVSDLNLDGRPDLVFGNQRYSANSVTVLLNTGATTATGTLTSTPNPSYIGQPFNITASLKPPGADTTYTGDITFYVDGNSIGTVALSGNVATIAGPLTLSAGTHQLSATWPGDANDPSLTLTATQTVLQLPLQISLDCSPNPSGVGQTVTLATQFIATPPAGLPASTAPYTGTLSFYDGAMLLGQQQVASAGFSFDVSTLAAGTHTILASYASDSVFAPSSASCSQVVNALPTTSVLSVSPATATYGSPVTLTATVSPTTPPGPSVPAGTVIFYNGAAAIGTGTLANGVATTTLSTLAGGTDNLTCTYNGSSIYSTSNCNVVPVAIAAAATVLTLTPSLNPAPALTTVTFTAHLVANNQSAPAGNIIVLSLNGQTISLTTDATGTATYSINTLTPGSYPVTASFAATGNFLASSAALTEVIEPIATSTRLTVTPSPAYFSQVVTMVATVSSQTTSTQVPGGSVSFFDGTTLLGTQPVSASGTATFAISTLAIGTHPITAVFNPSDEVFSSSTSPGFNQVILASGFTITLSPATITLAPGATGTAAVQLASVGDFAGPLALTYGTLPTYATASMDPATVTLTAAGAASSTLTLKTLLKAPNNTSARRESRQLPVVFTAIVLLFVPLAGSRRKMLTRLLGLVLVLAALQAITGCTNTSYTADVVAPGTYELPITASDLNHNSQTATLTVVVEP